MAVKLVGVHVGTFTRGLRVMPVPLFEQTRGVRLMPMHVGTRNIDSLEGGGPGGVAITEGQIWPRGDKS
jgi:hypothetical protein